MRLVFQARARRTVCRASLCQLRPNSWPIVQHAAKGNPMRGGTAAAVSSRQSVPPIELSRHNLPPRLFTSAMIAKGIECDVQRQQEAGRQTDRSARVHVTGSRFPGTIHPLTTSRTCLKCEFQPAWPDLVLQALVTLVSKGIQETRARAPGNRSILFIFFLLIS